MRRFKRVLTGVIAVIGLFALFLVISFAMPVETWRTGRLPAPPLPLIEGGPAIEPPDRVWIDTDAACGDGRRTDPDDCLALVLLAKAPGFRVAGISTVFGNTEIDVTDRTTRALVRRLRADGAALPDVLRGAGAPAEDPAQSSPARDGLRRALEDAPLTILALGPLTNVAAALDSRPDLQDQVERVIAVMGRRPGHIFHPAEGNGQGILFGHGPVFRDMNFDMDRAAAVKLLDMGLPISLIPYDVARQVRLGGDDLERIARSGTAGQWVAARALGWLDFWRDEIGLDGFYPFDLMAVAYALEPRNFNCTRTMAWVGRDDRLNNLWFHDPPALQIGPARTRPEDSEARQHVIYCPDVGDDLHGRLMERLTGSPLRRDS
ncbi:MAG: nucleoside hydrolase [Nitrococcus mobilis]|nr:nucleoside hydrolase [Nitrococcus mobilis]